MKVFVAGATGAIGRPLLPLLAETGHEVTGTTRSEAKAEAIRAAGATPVVVDARDPDALRREVHRAQPDVLVNQLTALPDALDFRDKEALAATNRLRREAGPVLAEAAADADARRIVSQSVAFFYAPAGGPVKSEDDPLMAPPEGSAFADGVASLSALERATLETDGIEGLVLRYGYFYGPGTYYAADGSTAEQVRRRRFPIVGAGTGIFSFVHVDDAAAATLAALTSGAPGVYNVCDDEPAALKDWLPVYAEALGAKPPRRVPAWLARLAAGREAAGMATILRGASNEKAKRDLGWSPHHPSWRQGFRDALG